MLMTQTSTCFCVLSLRAALLKSYLGYLDVPVAENIPDEIIELRDSHAQLEFLKVIGNFINKGHCKADDPLILEQGLRAART